MNQAPRTLLLAAALLSSFPHVSAYADDTHASADELALAAAQLTADAGVAAAAATIVTATLDPADCAGNGAWSSVINWVPHIPVSVANLPDGRLLTFASNQRTSFPAGPEFTYAATWNPATGVFQEINHTSHDMFCGGIALLADGRVMVNGGRNEVTSASIFDWRTNAWTRVQNMTGGRWYNTTVAYGQGNVFTATGSGTGNRTAERWNATAGWTNLTGIPWGSSVLDVQAGYARHWHPFLSLAPDGRILHFGPTDTMHWLTMPGTGSISDAGPTVPGDHYPKEGSFAMYDEGKILVAGGGANTTQNPSDSTTGTSTKLAYTVDMTTTPPTIAATASMANVRQFANAVVIPSGEVMVIGGNTSGLKFNDTGSVMPCEIWSPKTRTWRTVASISVPRNYHSTALLLPDGRVWSGGGGLGGANHQDAQLYTPPCLFKADGTAATRPVLSSAPSGIGPGMTFAVSGTANLVKFAFIRMASTTHAVNTDQRYLSLPVTQTSPGNYQLTAHANPNVMTPGYWMLFGIAADGVYSQAKVIQVDPALGVTITDPGAQFSTINTAASLQIQATSPAGTTKTFSATGLPDGLSIHPSTGLISGTMTRSGVFNVSVTIASSNLTATQAFPWTVLLTNTGSGTILREWWLGIPNADLASLTNAAAYPSSPTGKDQRTSFEVPVDWADNLGQRVRGYVYPPVTGQYRFWIAGDDESRLILGTSRDPSTGAIIARVPTWSSSRQWDKFPEQQSVLINLVAGQSYYIEALMKEGGGGDNLAVAWALPGTSTPVIIAGQYLSPWLDNRAPTITHPGSQISVVGGSVNLQIQASDADNDGLTFSATGLPTGLTINPATGRITGTSQSVGTANPTVSVTDNRSAAVSVTFSWTTNPQLDLASPAAAVPVVAGTAVAYTITGSGGVNVRYQWSWGDGTAPSTSSSAAAASHSFANPGRYEVAVTATDDTGRVVTQTLHQLVYATLTARAPVASSSIVYEDRVSGNDRLWSINHDNDSVSVFDAVTRARLAEIPVGKAPRGVAVAPDGRAWVTNVESATISIISGTSLAVVQTVTLPRGSRPYAVVFDPDGSDAWVTCEATGKLLRFAPATAVQTASLDVGLDARHLSVSGDGARVLVSRFITPRLPGEETGTITTSATAGAEVLSVLTASLSTEKKVILQHSERPDTQSTGRGIPNYLGPAIISPDGRTAWVPSKQDNIKRGTLRDGQQLTHDQTIRSITSRIVLTSGVPAATDAVADRVDFDNAGIASNGVFDRTGGYLFVALEGSREVAVIDAWNKKEIRRFSAGRAPQGIAISPDGRTIYVQNFMDRTLTVHDVGALIDGRDQTPALVATLNSITTERLAANVLAGKRHFYDAADERVAFQQYISCASCHNDGAQDGRVWDFTGVGEGLRNTITLRGHGGTAQGPLHWTGNFDEVQDFENQIRSLAQGTGLITAGTPHASLATPNAGRSADLDALAAYVASLTASGESPHRQSGGALTAAAVQGQAVFAQQNCASCHGGPQFTISELNVFADVGTVKATTGKRLDGVLPGLDIPTLRGLWNTAPYLHDGSSATLAEAVLAHQDVTISATDLSSLVAYLQQIDDQPDLPPATVLADSPLPSADVGDVGSGSQTGYVAETETYFIDGSGRDVFFDEDGFRFVYQRLAGDGEIIARVTSQNAANPWAKTGVMIREDLTGGARHSMAFTTPAAAGNGFGMVWREAENGSTSYAEGAAIHAIPNNWVRLVRTGDLLTGYQSSDGSSWRVMSSATLAGLPAELYFGLAVTSSDASVVARSTFDRVTIRSVAPPVGGLNLVGTDVGNAAVVGSTVLDGSSGTYTLKGSGSDIFFTEDGFQFAHQTLTGDGEIIARVTSHIANHPWSKAGVMLREGITGAGRHATVFTTPTGAGNGFGMVWRPTAAAATEYSSGGTLNAAPNNWVRLVRTGNVVSGYTSADGGAWTLMGATAFTALADTIQVGLAVTSSDNSALATASFDNVQIIKGIPPTGGPVLAGVDVGIVFTPGTTVRDASSYTLKASGSDVFFDADSFHFAHIAVEGDGEILARVSSQANTNPWAKSGVMIRESLTAGSRHAMAFTTPIPAGNGYGMVWRPTANAATQYAAGPNVNAAPNNWVRLQRQGDTIIAATSSDGTAWTELSRTSFSALPGTLYFGVALTAGDNVQYATAVFDEVQFTDNPPVVAAGAPSSATVSRRLILGGVGETGSTTGPVAATDVARPGAVPTTNPVVNVPRLTLTRLEDGRLSASFRRSPGSAARVAIHGLRDLRQSPAGWREITDQPAVTTLTDGVELVEFIGIERTPIFDGATEGFVRLQAEVDLDGDGFAETLDHGETLGWAQRSFAVGDQTFGVPFVTPELFHTTILGVESDALSILGSEMPSGAAFYAEIRSGDYSGHRFEIDEAASTATRLVLDLDSTEAVEINTLASLPNGLRGAAVTVRAHQTVKEAIAAGALTAGSHSKEADRLLFYRNGAYEVLWLIDLPSGPKWVAEGDASLIDQSTRILKPGEGLLLRAMNVTGPLWLIGAVREVPLALPARPGTTMIANPWPTPASPNSLGLSVTRGFIGGSNANTSTRLATWKADLTPGVSGFDVWFLLSSSSYRRWIADGDTSLTDATQTELLQPVQAAFLTLPVTPSTVTIPVPWRP